jgi:hypothetical protein
MPYQCPQSPSTEIVHHILGNGWLLGRETTEGMLFLRLAEHVLGKDGVGSSILLGSTIISLISQNNRR